MKTEQLNGGTPATNRIWEKSRGVPFHDLSSRRTPDVSQRYGVEGLRSGRRGLSSPRTDQPAGGRKKDLRLHRQGMAKRTGVILRSEATEESKVVASSRNRDHYARNDTCFKLDSTRPFGWYVRPRAGQPDAWLVNGSKIGRSSGSVKAR